MTSVSTGRNLSSQIAEILRSSDWFSGRIIEAIAPILSGRSERHFDLVAGTQTGIQTLQRAPALRLEDRPQGLECLVCAACGQRGHQGLF